MYEKIEVASISYIHSGPKVRVRLIITAIRFISPSADSFSIFFLSTWFQLSAAFVISQDASHCAIM
jgi:hypothetical protein